MSKLEELKTLVADMFKDAEDKDSIEKLANINTTLDDVQKEQDDMLKKNADLIKSYKDLVQHSSFKDDKAPADPVNGGVVSFEDALENFLAKQNKTNQ